VDGAVTARATILMVNAEAATRDPMLDLLGGAGLRVVETATASEALERSGDGIDVVVVDSRPGGSDGLELLERLRSADADLPVIVVENGNDVPRAVRAMRLGADDYVPKPLEPARLVAAVERALERASRRRRPEPAAGESGPFARILGVSDSVRALRELLEKFAVSPASTVLLTGESGTGKDLAAHCIHVASARADGPFMHITCSAMPENLLESELFGHERGAFTGASQLKRGLLESADGGTVYLDEIGEMPPTLQAKLLRFLEEKVFKRVGGAKDIPVDVRVVAATNRNLDRAVRDGEFRPDLYYRLRVLAVQLPPLRLRDGDVPVLAEHFVAHFNGEFGRRVGGPTEAAGALLAAHPWPGNVRELRNALERAVLLASGDRLGPGDFGMLSMPVPAVELELPPHGLDLKQLERDLVVQALERGGWNRSRAAQLLGMKRDQIRYRIEKFGLEPPSPNGGSREEAR
jgi:DNA-binding NtrC family response regulator